jgi:hypothetical protein
MNTFVAEDTKRIIMRQAAFNDVDSGKRKISSWEIKTLDFPASSSKKNAQGYDNGDSPKRRTRSAFFLLC